MVMSFYNSLKISDKRLVDQILDFAKKYKKNGYFKDGESICSFYGDSTDDRSILYFVKSDSYSKLLIRILNKKTQSRIEHLVTNYKYDEICADIKKYAIEIQTFDDIITNEDKKYISSIASLAKTYDDKYKLEFLVNEARLVSRNNSACIVFTLNNNILNAQLKKDSFDKGLNYKIDGGYNYDRIMGAFIVLLEKPRHTKNKKLNLDGLNYDEIDQMEDFDDVDIPITKKEDNQQEPLKLEKQKSRNVSNLAKTINIEASKLLECFQYSDDEYDKYEVKEKVTNVINICQKMLDQLESEKHNNDLKDDKATANVEGKTNNEERKNQYFLESLRPYERIIVNTFDDRIGKYFANFESANTKYFYGFRDKEDIKNGINKYWFYFAKDDGVLVLKIKKDPKEENFIFDGQIKADQIDTTIFGIQKLVAQRQKVNQKIVEPQPPKIITVKKMSLFDSLRNICGHNCEEMTIKIPAATKTGGFECEPGPYKAKYCPKCQTYYVDDEDLLKARNIGIPLIQYKPQERVNMGSGYGKKGNDLALESILKKSGYTVDKKIGLTDDQRLKILKTIIEFKLVNKGRVIEYLKWFIQMNRRVPFMGDAINKWQIDLDALQKDK